MLSQESIFQPTEKSVIGNKRTTKINRLVDNRLVVIVIPVHFGDYISGSTSMHYTSDGELYVAVLRIGFVDHLAIGISTAKNNLLSIPERNGL